MVKDYMTVMTYSLGEKATSDFYNNQLLVDLLVKSHYIIRNSTHNSCFRISFDEVRTIMTWVLTTNNCTNNRELNLLFVRIHSLLHVTQF
jgi:hypothetical protein